MFPLFWGQFLVFKKVLNPQFVDRFCLLLGLSPLFLGSVSGLKKDLNSQFVDRFPLFFGSVSGFQKEKVLNS